MTTEGRVDNLADQSPSVVDLDLDLMLVKKDSKNGLEAGLRIQARLS